MTRQALAEAMGMPLEIAEAPCRSHLGLTDAMDADLARVFGMSVAAWQKLRDRSDEWEAREVEPLSRT